MKLLDNIKSWFKQKSSSEHETYNTIKPLVKINNVKPYSILYNKKKEVKHKSKRIIKNKFIIGGKYFRRIKSKDGSRQVIIGYECRKYIYSINDTPMNIVIMKQISGPETKKFTLDKHECIYLHVKWEQGLEVWPMDMNWIPEKKYNNFFF